MSKPNPCVTRLETLLCFPMFLRHRAIPDPGLETLHDLPTSPAPYIPPLCAWTHHDPVARGPLHWFLLPGLFLPHASLPTHYISDEMSPPQRGPP